MFCLRYLITILLLKFVGVLQAYIQPFLNDEMSYHNLFYVNYYFYKI
jgi:hypothetical protein